MVTSATLMRVSGGGNITVDLELIDPATAVVAMSAAELLVSGVTKGTKVTQTALQPVYVQQGIEEVKAMVRAAQALGPTESPLVIGSAVLRDTMPAATQVFNAAGPAVITGLRITIPAGGAGSYLFMIAGTAQSSDAANAGASVQLAKNGVAVGTQLRWGVAQFIGNNSAAMGAGAMGLQFNDNAIVGDFYEVLVGVLPGGVGGDDITVTDCSIVAIRLS